MKPYALTLVQDWHLRSEAAAYRNLLKNATIVVCNPSIPVEKIRESCPDAIVLLNFDSHTCPSYGTSEFYENLRAALDEHFLLAFPGVPGSVIIDRYGNYELKLDFDTYRDYADWIDANENVQKADGLYIDNLWGELPQRWLEDTGREEWDTTIRWKGLVPYFTALVRYGRLVLANVGSRRPERAAVDAITIEQEHLEPLYRSLRYFTASAAPHLNVAWYVPDDHPILVDGVVMQGRRLPDPPKEA
jgi:hypothetical protein